MPVKIKSTSGSVTLDAQDVAGDQTLTVPSIAGGKTLLTTDGDGSSLTGVGVDGITSASSAGTAINIDSANNVGIQATPESHHSNWTSLQFGGTGNLTGQTSQSANKQVVIANNAYVDSTETWSHIVTDEASIYRQMGGKHTFLVAPSGTADANLALTTALEIKNDGRGLSQFTAKAWCSLNGSAGSGSQIQDSHNVSSTTDNGTGDITITFSNSLANTNYTAAGMVPGNVPSRGGMWISFAYGYTHRTTSYLRVNTGYHSNADYDGAVYDVNPVTVQVFGD